MKTLKKVMMIGLLSTSSLTISNLNAQSNNAKTETTKKTETVTFKVWGNCGTCKKNIEKSLKVKGVKKANWNKDSKIIEVTFDSSVITIEQIHKYIASAGYDTDLVKGDDNSYKKLDQCCQYERKN